MKNYAAGRQYHFKLLVIWLTIVRFMCVWKDRVCSSSMVNLVLCNQCLSPLMLWVRIPRYTTLCDKSLSVTCDMSVVFSTYSGFLHQSWKLTVTLQLKYCWKWRRIIESANQSIWWKSASTMYIQIIISQY